MHQVRIVGTYAFRDAALLDGALCHPSGITQTNRTHITGGYGFQRLEFMGDSVLNLVITDMLMEAFPTESEGALSKRRAVLVSRESCNTIGTYLQLNSLIHVGTNVDMFNSSIVADAVEAVIGAIYIDSGKNMQVCREWILQNWEPFLSKSHQSKPPPIDPKTKLQEYTQSHKMNAPVYNETHRDGPDHDLTIFVNVDIPGFDLKPASGAGRTKKAAEKQAAAAMLQNINSYRNTVNHAANTIADAVARLCF